VRPSSTIVLRGSQLDAARGAALGAEVGVSGAPVTHPPFDNLNEGTLARCAPLATSARCQLDVALNCVSVSRLFEPPGRMKNEMPGWPVANVLSMTQAFRTPFCQA
jgi:hypothetical protein